MTTKGTCGWRNVSARNDRQWPWHVLIIVGERCVCGGTLIAPGYVATSTLCLSRVWKWRVKVGWCGVVWLFLVAHSSTFYYLVILPKFSQNNT